MKKLVKYMYIIILTRTHEKYRIKSANNPDNPSLHFLNCSTHQSGKDFLTKGSNLYLIANHITFHGVSAVATGSKYTHL